MRFVQDQHAMHFIMWRRRVHLLDLDRVETKAFRLRISLVKDQKMKKWLEDDNPNIAQHGQQIDYLIPCLDPDIANSKMISDE